MFGRNSFNLSSFLCWQSLKKSYQQTHHNFNSKRWLEVLLDNFTILTPFFTHVYWMNEALTQGFGSIACSEQKRSAAYLGALPAKESVCVTQPFQSENCSNSYPIYSRVHKSSDSFFSKILEKPSIMQKKMIPHIKGLDFSQRWSKKKSKWST